MCCAAGSRLHLGGRQRYQLVHLDAHLGSGDGDALGGKVLHDLVLDVLIAGFLEIGRNHFLGVGIGGVTGQAELLRCPKTEQLIAAHLSLEFLLLVESELLLETFLALVKSAHSSVPIPANGKRGRVVAARSPT
jgi:hypothetical protein